MKKLFKNVTYKLVYKLNHKPFYLYLIILLILPSTVIGEEKKPIEILEEADSHRGIQHKSFSMKMRVNSMIAGKSREQIELNVYVDNESIPDKWKTLVRITAPVKRKGQINLLENDRMWFFKPGTRRPIRISPSQRLLGSASTGDVASFNFREYYDIKSVSNVKVGKTDAYFFDLIAKPNSAATYHKTHLWIQEKTYLPIQADFFAKSGRKLKTCYYGKFKKILGKKRVTEIVIVDSLRPNNITKIHTLSMKIKSLPQSYYKPDQLTEISF